ncbi:universal stress protein [Actinoplanes sp. NBRC 14428]|uniref:Nucleotide-binding universal stress UspA family protein n=1 Tax=Pseudosporangium ferrugineum TaxID=439699 RepID=A0A2T0SG49_9ACTN|nr:universal stress protein [Pseudosporangium ferrugineum]PRY32398.1 nucleotide-binding universal stress UspA family protein [Pseudosporangium ferrugineum]BCJ49352.1 universal stress protein [Actinoplanes sp. NBRC 14428]
MTTRAIIVATDGTAPARAAVRWAAREADRRGLALRIVYAYDWEWREGRFDYSNQYVDVARQLAEAVTVSGLDQAREVAPGIRIERDTLLGHAASQLLTIAGNAELMVLGNRGRGGFASLLLGSVSQRVATHAPCPVVVVRGREEVTDGPVAVGVDDSPAAEQVLATAFEVAATRGAALAVVHSYLPAVPLWLSSSVPAVEISTPEEDAAERERLEQIVAPWRAKFPDVPVETILTHESAAGVLVGVSHGAQLVVVGTHDHGAVAGTFLGSTVMQLLHHANCPVFIARPVERRAT